MTITLTDDQRAGLELAVTRLAAGEQVTKIFGYAGTGKTTIARELARMIRAQGRAVAFGAYTGKAADVLTRRGCPAQTIHSLLYSPPADHGEAIERVKRALSANPDDFDLQDELESLRERAARPEFEISSTKAADVDVLILDEVSMIDDAMAADLLATDVQIIVLGDPAQLPPIDGEGYFTRGGEAAADVLLTQVHRHGGTLLDLATFVRERGRAPKPHPRGQMVVSDQAWVADDMVEFDQILVGTNRTRWKTNQTYRALTGRVGQTLRPGERIIVLANNRPYEVLNGQQFIAVTIDPGKFEGTLSVGLACTCGQETDQGDRCPLCGWRVKTLPVWEMGFTDRGSDAALRDMPYRSQQRAVYATYAYAITVHKAQGSQWENVLVMDQSRFFEDDAGRWLYTAVTRASQMVKLVTGG